MFKSSYWLIIISLLIVINWPDQVMAAIQNSTALVEQQATIAAIKKALPVIVNITVNETAKQEVDGQLVGQKIRRYSGAGFVISNDGLILTNRHVINQTSDNGEYRIGNNRDLDMGTTIIAIGNALGRYQNSATKEIISGIGHNLGAFDDNGQNELLTNIIQTDAQINPGNSDRPLINLNGRVVGINVARDASGSYIGFAIPIDDAKPVINSVKRVSRIIRPQLGVSYLIKNRSQNSAW